MTTSDRLKKGTNDWVYLLIGAIFVVTSTVDLLQGDEPLGPVSYLIGAVALFSFYGAPRVDSKALQWLGWIAFAAFLVLSVIDLLGLAS